MRSWQCDSAYFVLRGVVWYRILHRFYMSSYRWLYQAWEIYARILVLCISISPRAKTCFRDWSYLQLLVCMLVHKASERDYYTQVVLIWQSRDHRISSAIDDWTPHRTWKGTLSHLADLIYFKSLQLCFYLPGTRRCPTIAAKPSSSVKSGQHGTCIMRVIDLHTRQYIVCRHASIQDNSMRYTASHVNNQLSHSVIPPCCMAQIYPYSLHHTYQSINIVRSPDLPSKYDGTVSPDYRWTSHWSGNLSNFCLDRILIYAFVLTVLYQEPQQIIISACCMNDRSMIDTTEVCRIKRCVYITVSHPVAVGCTTERSQDVMWREYKCFNRLEEKTVENIRGLEMSCWLFNDHGWYAAALSVLCMVMMYIR